MRNLLSIFFAAIFVALLTACKNQKNEYNAARESFEKGYFSPDVKMAERALLEYRETIAHWQREKVAGHDYEQAFRINDARLVVLYSYMGEKDKVALYYQDFTNRLVRTSGDEASKIKIPGQAQLLQSIDQAERKLPLRWKLNNHSISSKHEK